MTKKEAVTIQTERLTLRHRKEEDLPHMVKCFNTEDVRMYLGGRPPRDEHSMLRAIRGRKETDWVVTLKGDDTYIGECLINSIVDDYLGDIGYLFMSEYWGNGYAYESMTAIIDYTFNTLGLKRLCAEIDDKNERSKKLITKLGFDFVALLPEADFGGRVADVAYYSRKNESVRDD